MAFLSKRKLLLDATSRPETSFSNFTKTYRTSDNVEDRRGERKDAALSEPIGSTMKKMGPRGTNTPMGPGGGGTGKAGGDFGSDQTPDDFATSDLGGKFSPTTDRQTRKVSPEEAIDKTFNRR